MGLEPTTTSLATRYSTTELHPHVSLARPFLGTSRRGFKWRISEVRAVDSGRREKSPKEENAMFTLTREEVRELDRRAITGFGVPGVVLMENAGRGCAELLMRLNLERQP